MKPSWLLVIVLFCAVAACAPTTTPTLAPPTAALTQLAGVTQTATAQSGPTTTATTIPPTVTSSVMPRLLTTKPFIPTPLHRQPVPGVPSYSPNQQYYLLFAADGTRVYREVDQQLLSQSAIVIDPNQSDVLWAPNSQEAVTSDLQHVYLWFTDGRPPFAVLLGETYSLTWSPDSTRLAAVENYPTADSNMLIIIQANGSVQRVGDGGIRPEQMVNKIDWITPKVVEVWASDGACCGLFVYFNTDTGKFYPSWMTNVDEDQEALLSPNKVWRVARSSYRLWQGDPYASPDYFEHVDTVLNFETGLYYKLYDGSTQDIDWLGWTPDSGTFYFVNRPASPTAVASADLPFGWLALNPATHTLKVIVAQAIFAQLSADQTRACVVFPAKDGTGQLGLDAGWFDLATGVLTGRQHIANQVPYSSVGNQGLLPPDFAVDACRLAG